MKFILVMIAACLISAPVFAEGYDLRFFSNLPDIPLMADMVEVEQQAFDYDKPEGRVSESTALLNGGGREAVIAFYAQTLPQMGWRAARDGRYVRGAEQLELTFNTISGDVFVKINVRPLTD